MTLEVGIDIGDVDLVICMDPPFSIGSFLQRIGRGCRRLQGKTRVLWAARDRASSLIFEALVAQSAVGVPATPAAPIRRSILVQQALAYLRQVDKHSRTVEQCRNTLALSVLPVFSAETVADVLRAMTGQKLLRIQDSVVEPAEEGWSFIESTRIFNNIGSTFSDVALVDADTGMQLANVRGLKTGATGVQIGGHSYEVVGSPSARVRKVRATTEIHPTPTYAARKLPYAADVGVALARRFDVQAIELLILNLGDALAAFTWLGRLQNLSLEGLLERRRVVVKASSFCIKFSGVQPADCLRVLRELASEPSPENPLLDLPVEKVSDLGPHFKLLNEEQQRQTRGDWFQLGALRKYIGGLEGHRIVDKLF